jgi:DNA-binding Lrp family transcriptional regulator
MDHFDRTIIQLLVDTENMKFNEIQEKVDFSHNTLQQHLEDLLEKGIIKRIESFKTNLEGLLTSIRYLKASEEGL